jgi:hypothetical protein
MVCHHLSSFYHRSDPEKHMTITTLRCQIAALPIPAVKNTVPALSPNFLRINQPNAARATPHRLRKQ